ncbi:MAG: hypothetical protein NT029_08540 [Armatimonadetes bacterium]|nr:hypothetical protein [Armatimonadota bacterium]
MTEPLHLVLARLARVRPSRSGFMARCPAHDDRNPSLSVRVAPDGRVLVHCFAGCPLDAVLAALGLRLRDLRPEARP